MHPTVAAVVSIGTRVCPPSRYGTRRGSTGVAAILQLWSLDHCRGLDGCWTRGREAQRSWQLVRWSEGDVDGAAPMMLVVVAQACLQLRDNPDRYGNVDRTGERTIATVMTIEYITLI